MTCPEIAPPPRSIQSTGLPPAAQSCPARCVFRSPDRSVPKCVCRTWCLTPKALALRVASVAAASSSDIFAFLRVEAATVTSGRWPDQKCEAVFLKDCLGIRRTQVGQIALRLGLCSCGRGDRVYDRRVGVVWKRANNLDAWVNLGVRRIDDAKRRFATRHQGERCAHVFHHRKFRCGGVPRAELLQRCLGIFADGHRAHITGRDASVARKLREIKARANHDITEL